MDDGIGNREQYPYIGFGEQRQEIVAGHVTATVRFPPMPTARFEWLATVSDDLQEPLIGSL